MSWNKWVLKLFWSLALPLLASESGIASPSRVLPMNYSEKISVAPMMDCTDRHFRYLLRLISKHTTLYTEMVHTNQIIHGGVERFLSYSIEERPLVLQLGGSEPSALAQCAKLAEKLGYDAVNLNVGCPSERVQNGQFGACLMKQGTLVAECVAAMQEAISIPVTVKTRLGVDEFDSDAYLYNFIETVAKTGCENFIIHARKAWLKGLNPKQNRTLPPLNYERVYQLKEKFPELYIGINGGIKTIPEIREHLKYVDAVMLGREAFNNPYLFSEIDRLFFADATELLSRIEVFRTYITYAKQQFSAGVKLNFLIRPILGLFHGLPGARQWRGYLTTEAYKQERGVELLESSLAVF